MVSNTSCIDVTALYDTYHARFMAWSRRQFPKYDAAVREDAFHDALVIYWESCQKGKFQDLHAPLINLLIGIAYNLLRHKSRGIQLQFPEIMPESQAEAVKNILDSIMAAETETQQTTWLNEGFSRLGEECQRLLLLYFYEKKKIPEIMNIMAYKTENATSAIKSRCLRTLKNFLDNHGKSE